jgi:hypothetical protein
MSDEPTTRLYTKAPPPPAAAPSDDRRYVVCVQRGGVYAVAYRDGWIPTHAIGPFAGEQLRTAPGEQDWSNPQDARSWNVRTLVNLCEPERQRMIDGISRVTRMLSKVKPQEIRGRTLTEKPELETVKADAEAAIADASATHAGD